MPCRDDRDSCEPSTRERVVDNPETKKKLDLVEAMLCSACRVLEQNKFVFELNPTLDNWWAAHKAEDERVAKEKAAKLAKERFEKERLAEVMEKAFRDLTDSDKKLLRKFKCL
jgi:hypothetical protein